MSTGRTIQRVQPPVSTTGINTSVAGTTTPSTSFLAANIARKGATIFNDDTAGTGASIFLSLGAIATTTSYTVKILAQGYYQVPYSYLGIITGVWSAATGNARITELT